MFKFSHNVTQQSKATSFDFKNSVFFSVLLYELIHSLQPLDRNQTSPLPLSALIRIPQFLNNISTRD